MPTGTLKPNQTDSIKYLFVWPALFIVLLVTLFPLIYALTVSFQSVRLIPPLPVRFVGFDNYQSLLESARFWQSVGTTLFIVLSSVAIQYVVGFMLALALHNKVPGEKLYRVVFLLPMFMAPIAVALVARMMFHSALGPVNDFFSLLGFENLPFLTETSWALGVLVTVEVWQWTPFVTLLMLAGLQGLPKDVYEAASLENVPPWRQFWDITFPMLLPLSVVVVFIRIVEGFKIIDTVYILTGGGPGTSTETLTLFAYNQGFKTFNLGEASALSFLFLIVIVVLGSVYLAAVKPVVEKRT
ncbi:putative ABC-type sugar transport systems,permease component [Vibrio nigripulchritudo MADA3029]|uniref:ABC-type sugar transport systems,permease component n=1 Tax=Vibrio nigripulchritudo SOn1 TaxID=1238450 RepID=A0AAV2VR35_9VIBR|nr:MULTISPECIES: sugar ABC transporter permease [Vibrio]EGU55616.1 transmembrane component of ABC transporter [Vibrio nigripulchritudo ATCC 27043]KJY78748.1 ABC transporter permease [Vibrio nigripulchritudo]UAB72965.1 sugar ABC transporter permease [Vibrio sp. SCSIO 43132]CCN48971.1 putative ABC-type sugar transport systems,permease component [Vibrio nigripulchritudo MADA3020]CCN56161.1 putative ABC-type sugar transport systems,permease component [Vibrio nigripulchritudo MADA3021]